MGEEKINNLLENFINDKEMVIKAKDLDLAYTKFKDMFIAYSCGIKEIKTKLDILNEEFRMTHERNPIEYIKDRVKSPMSILEKLERKGFPLTVASARENLNDIAGIRVICSFVSDIYTVAEMLTSQDDVKVVEVKDYIKNPKPNGYRSLHLVLEIPVFFSDHKENIRVEVQIRTIAMDFWASLEHQLHYKSKGNCHEEIVSDLKECADIIAETDMKMMNIHERVEKF